MSRLESMTGSATLEKRIARTTFTVSLRGVNHRFSDFYWKVPDILLALQPRMEEILGAKVQRGHVDVRIEAGDGLQTVQIDRDVLREYTRMAKELAGGRAGLKAEMVPLLLGLPGVSRVSTRLPGRFSPPEFLALFERTVVAFRSSRQKEGAALGKAIRGHLKSMKRSLAPISSVLKRQRQSEIGSLRKQLRGVLKNEDVAESLFDAVRESWPRINITEEAQRLKLHIAAVEEQLTQGGAVGKKIEFFAQEMLREANTIGSKVGDFSVRTAVVEIKTQIENVREQVRNLC